MVTRNSYWKMMKQGRFRSLRNLPVGWVLQILHSTDNSERIIRILLELIIIGLLWLLLGDYSLLQGDVARLLFVFIVVHTLSWYFFGNFWVYMLDSFLWVKNPGVEGVFKYIEFVRDTYAKTEMCEAILVYGSMSRRQFHGRSDLDLRIIRKPGIKGVFSVLLGLYVRIPAAISRMPVDLQVVDSLEFLDKQMRKDELPIVVFKSPNIQIPNAGLHFVEIVEDPSLVLKSQR